ncbi:hypothetical protein NDU88_012536, partial [Pleurodeles waltl]
MAKDHDYNASAQKVKPTEVLASASSDHSSEKGDNTPCKCKKKSHHQEEHLPTFEPEDIVHPRSSLWLPPPEVADYVESHIRHGFDFTSKVTETPELNPTLVTFLKKSSKDPKKVIDRA